MPIVRIEMPLAGILFHHFTHIVPSIHNIFAKLTQSHGLLLYPPAQKFRSIPAKVAKIKLRLFLCPWQESNPHLTLRTGLFYPLNYKGG
jgi:hypothetical protein